MNKVSLKKLLSNSDQYDDEIEKIDLLSDIALTIIEYRLEHNLSQKKLAEILGVTQPMVSKLESGIYNPTIMSLFDISKKLKLHFKLEFEEKLINYNVQFSSLFSESSESLRFIIDFERIVKGDKTSLKWNEYGEFNSTKMYCNKDKVKFMPIG